MNKPKKPKALATPRPIFKRSRKYVNGEINIKGFIAIGINNGLMNIKGNLIRIVRIIVFAGVSVGGTERIKLKEENENADKIIPGIKIKRLMSLHSSRNIIPRIKGTVENMHPKRKELHTFPKRIVLIDIGQVINRSRVFCLVSQGKTTGPMEVDVKNSTIAINPLIIKIGRISLPMVNAKNNIIGKAIP